MIASLAPRVDSSGRERGKAFPTYLGSPHFFGMWTSTARQGGGTRPSWLNCRRGPQVHALIV